MAVPSAAYARQRVADVERIARAIEAEEAHGTSRATRLPAYEREGGRQPPDQLMTTRADFVVFLERLKRNPSLLGQLEPLEFRSFVAHVMSSHGYTVSAPPKNNITGVDFVVSGSLDAAGSVFAKCKRYPRDRKVGYEIVARVNKHITRGTAAGGLVVTTSRFTKEAIRFALHKAPAVRLVDRDKLLALAIEAHAQEAGRAESIAYRLNSLPLVSVGVIQNPNLATTPQVLLPKQFATRIVAVDEVPLDLLRAVTSDPRHLRALSPRHFEEFIAELVDGLGFADVVLTPRSFDGGKDVIASKRIHGIPLTFYFECKKYAEGNKVQLETLRALLGVVAHDSRKANVGVLVTTSTFTKGANELILSECRLDGKDYAGITGWMDDYMKGAPLD